MRNERERGGKGGMGERKREKMREGEREKR